MTAAAGTAPSGPPRVRMSREGRREQLLDIGVRLLATRPLEELSIELLSDEAGISRGLLYHYFGNKQDFHVAVVRRAVGDVYAITAPQDLEDPLAQLVASLGAYLDYVRDHHVGYLSLVRAAHGPNEELRRIYAEARDALVDRVFHRVDGLDALGVEDSAGTRLLARSWAALVEDAVLAWVADRAEPGEHAGVPREALLDRLAGALVALIAPA